MSGARRLAYLVSVYPHMRHSYVLREIRGLRKLGWEVETLALRPDDRLSGEYTEEEREERNATFYVLRSGIVNIVLAHLTTLFSRPLAWCAGLGCALSYGEFCPGRTLYGVCYFAEAVIAGWWLRRRGISHVHTHYASTVAWIMARVFPLEVSMSIHGSGEFDEPRAFRLREKIAASRFVRAISHFGRSQIMRAAPYDQWGKIEICRLGIDPDLFPPRPVRGNSRAFELLCVGGMASPRAFQMILQALSLAGLRDFVLRFVGDGPDRPVLQQLASDLGIADSVIFEGWKHQGQLRSIYADADAFVFSSFAEGIPVVLMEAMASGIPCIAPRIMGIPELIRDGVDGLLFAASDVEDLSAAIIRLVREPGLARSLSESGRARVLDLYDLNRNIRTLGAMFERRLAGDSRMRAVEVAGAEVPQRRRG